ncbi:protein kinase domain-containing protein [Streptomyces sp. IBSNAI002]|uniref:protein kinase domain-containing protein n=1 Tax=Streptomyces sp. IBSNAI002 TaxID=3457500 RepID=UPI003FD010BA
MRGITLADRYRLVGLLGAGGMGEVWRAVDERLGRQVAVKILICSEDEDLVLRLDSEGRAAASLCDPHVVAVHDLGEAVVAGCRVVYLVMELVEGQSLGQVLADGLPAVADAVAWGEQICHGLQAAHAAGVVHRDIKPGNVLLAADGRVKVCDFGIARRADAVGHALTGTGVVIGTPSYMSPEQARGDAEIGSGSDLYSLGCLLYELLTGAPPFPGGGWPVLAQHQNQAPVPVRSHRPEVPAELERLVAELLSKDPQGRPATAADVAQRLRALPATTMRVADSVVAAAAASGTAARTALASAPVVAPTTVGSVRPTGRASRSAAWRAGALTGVLVCGQLMAFTSFPDAASVLMGLLAGGCVAVGSRLEARHEGARGGESEQGVVGVFAALLIASVAMVVLLGWSAMPWWAAVLVGMVTGPVLVMAAAAVRALVEQVLHRRGQEAELASTAGLLSGAVGCALLAAGSPGPVVGIVAAGVGTWIASSLAVAALLSATRACGRHV